MKKKPIALALCLMMLFSLLTACQQPVTPVPTGNPAPTETAAPTPEPTSAPTTEEDWRKEWEEQNRIQQENSKKLYGDMLVMQDEMIAFFLAHQEEFETFAFLLHDLDASDPDHKYKYNVGSNSLSWFDIDYDLVLNRNWGVIEEHPVLAEGEFLCEPQFFLYVQWGYSHWQGMNEYCRFGAAVPDELNNSYYAMLEIIYSETEPIPDEYQEMTELAPHWYYYYMFCE